MSSKQHGRKALASSAQDFKLPCQNYIALGVCPYGNKCHFIHPAELASDLTITEKNAKKPHYTFNTLNWDSMEGVSRQDCDPRTTYLIPFSKCLVDDDSDTNVTARIYWGLLGFLKDYVEEGDGQCSRSRADSLLSFESEEEDEEDDEPPSPLTSQSPLDMGTSPEIHPHTLCYRLPIMMEVTGGSEDPSYDMSWSWLGGDESSCSDDYDSSLYLESSRQRRRSSATVSSLEEGSSGFHSTSSSSGGSNHEDDGSSDEEFVFVPVSGLAKRPNAATGYKGKRRKPRGRSRMHRHDYHSSDHHSSDYHYEPYPPPYHYQPPFDQRQNQDSSRNTHHHQPSYQPFYQPWPFVPSDAF